MNVGVKVSGKSVFAAATGIKFGSKGRVTPPAEVRRALTKGELRAVRRGLVRIGRHDLMLATIN